MLGNVPKESHKELECVEFRSICSKVVKAASMPTILESRRSAVQPHLTLRATSTICLWQHPRENPWAPL